MIKKTIYILCIICTPFSYMMDKDDGFDFFFDGAEPQRGKSEPSSPTIPRPRRLSFNDNNDDDNNNSDTDSSFSDDSLFSVESYDKKYETISCLLASKRKRKKHKEPFFVRFAPAPQMI